MYIELNMIHQLIDFTFQFLSFLQQWKQLLRAKGNELVFQVLGKLELLDQRVGNSDVRYG